MNDLYKIEVTRVVKTSALFEVTADSYEEAKRKVDEQARNCVFSGLPKDVDYDISVISHPGSFIEVESNACRVTYMTDRWGEPTGHASVSHIPIPQEVVDNMVDEISFVALLNNGYAGLLLCQELTHADSEDGEAQVADMLQGQDPSYEAVLGSIRINLYQQFYDLCYAENKLDGLHVWLECGPFTFNGRIEVMVFIRLYSAAWLRRDDIIRRFYAALGQPLPETETKA